MFNNSRERGVLELPAVAVLDELPRHFTFERAIGGGDLDGHGRGVPRDARATGWLERQLSVPLQFAFRRNRDEVLFRLFRVERFIRRAGHEADELFVRFL